MKISGPSQIQSKTVKKTGRKESGDRGAFSSALSGPGEAQAAGSVGGSAPLASVDALLALQEVPDATVGRSKGLDRANQMLDLLEDIRRGLLLGTIPLSRLENLASAARDQRGNTGDPALDAILADIELRATVELAKLGR